MRKHIKTPTIGEFLNEEFFIPMGLSAYKVAQAINVPVSRIQDILHDRRRITVDTSLRLAKLLGVSDDYFISLQDDIDIRNLKTELSEELDEIKRCCVTKGLQSPSLQVLALLRSADTAPRKWPLK